MGFNTSRQLILDVKAQDRLRQWFSQRGSAANLLIKCLSLGDSDVDYELSDQVSDIQVLSAPYNVQKIKSKLIYEGDVSNLTGKITSYLRYVDANGLVKSLYSYVPNKNFFSGIFPPTLANGFDWDEITFASITREGFIIYFQTLPDNFTEVDPNDNTKTRPLRFVETYDVVYTNLPLANTITAVTLGSPLAITTANPINLGDQYQILSGDEIVITGVNGILQTNGRYFAKQIAFNQFEIYYNQALTSPVVGSGTYVLSGSVHKWFSTLDTPNGSLFLSHTNHTFLGLTNGLIRVRGVKTGIVKEIKFNY